MWHKGPMRLWFRAGLAVFLLLLADTALAAPRLERERCAFKPPRGDKIECYTLIVPEDRAQGQNSRDVHLKVAILKAKRPGAADPVVYLAGGPGDSPLVASSAGADPLAEGDWWNDTATLRRRRDVIILSQRGAGGSTPNLDCFEPRSSEPARAKRRAITEAQERDILVRCRADFDKRKIDLAQYTTPALADDVADLVKALGLTMVNLYGISYGTRWALETMRRHPNIIRAAVLDAIYPPQINGEQNEPEIVRTVFEQLFAECASDKLCRERNPDLAANVKAMLERADRTPVELVLQLDDSSQPVKLDGPKLLLVLLQMMREGEAALVPEAVTALKRGDKRLLKQFAEDLESNDGGLLEQNAQQFDGLYNSIECRETWATVDRAARRKSIEAGGVYALNARTSKSPIFCPVWRVGAAPVSERQPVKASVPTLLLSGTFDWLTPPAWGREAARHLSSSRHVVFRAQGHGVVVQDPCAARLRDAFIAEPDTKRDLPCRADTPLNFTAAYERARNLP